MAAGDFFLPHQGLIRKIILNALIKPGYYSYEDFDELMQQVSELLLVREERITSSFQGRAKFSTYLAVVVVNICREIRKKAHRERSLFVSQNREGEHQDMGLFSKLRDTAISAESKIIIQEAVTKLHLILQTYIMSGPKLIFCLKALWQFPVNWNDLEIAWSTITEKEEIELLLESLNNQEVKMTKSKVYSCLTRILEIAEKRKNCDDAIRKWIKDRIGEVIYLLNGDPPVSYFTEETLRYLFEVYCENYRSHSPKSSLPSILLNKKVNR